MAENFGERLRRLRIERGITQQEVAERAGRSRPWVTQLESGKRWAGKLPPHDDLRLVADALSLTVDELIGERPLRLILENRPSYPSETVPEIQTVPLGELLRRINARPAYGQRADDLKISAGKKKGRVPQGYDDSRVRKRLGAGDLPERIQLIEVEGDCMLKALYPGDIVHVDTRQTAEIGKIAAAVRFYDQVIVKFLREKDGHQYFESLDKKIVIPLDQYTRMLGPVVDVQRGIDRILAEL
jgi:transcriptional regulator with XRE-family HTH domain